MILIVLLVLLFILLYIKVVKPYDYWISKGVKQRKQIYLLGDHASFIFRKESFFDVSVSIYSAFPEERYMGMYQMTTPMLVLRDPELIKQICVKEFDYFFDRYQVNRESSDSISSKHLMVLKGSHWREMRATLSPNFTSSKMRFMFNLFSECADQYLKYFKTSIDTTAVDLKDIFIKYTNDAIATVAFGIKCDSINEETNEFYVLVSEITRYSFSTYMKLLIHALMPNIARMIDLKVFPQKVTDFFKNLIVDTIKVREEQGIIRPDMIHLLLEARKGKRKKTEEQPTVDTGFATVQEVIKPSKDCKITDEDIAAHALGFFFAGLEGVSTTMSLMAYELSINSDIQKRLQEEIDETVINCNGKLTYEALMKLKYMDMVVSETLRKWPIAGTTRLCTSSFTIEAVNSHEKPVTLEPGDIIIIPIYPMHRDPKYYPNPETFDPERFNDENKNNIKPYTYLPFGLGPRNCIGSRLSLLQVKTIFFYMLRNFDFVVVEKTDIPLKISKKTLNFGAENGLWAGLKPRII